MQRHAEIAFATRLNSFSANPALYWPDLVGRPGVLQMAARAATVRGLTVLDLNYPDHFQGEEPAVLARRIRDLGLEISGLAMRYYSVPAFRAGAFTHPDAATRQQAIDLTRRGIDAARACGAPMMTLWLGSASNTSPTSRGPSACCRMRRRRCWRSARSGCRILA